MRFATSVFKLFSSAVSSFSRASVVSSCAFIAFGIMPCSPCTSSAMRRVSSSRLRLAVLSSPMVDSTSARAASRRSVRAVSEARREAVSAASWSMRLKAWAKEASMVALSAVSWAGVGGAMRGTM